MKRKITITIPTNDKEVTLDITPVDKNLVVFKTGVPTFGVDPIELKEAIEEAEKYRAEFAEKEASNKVEEVVSKLDEAFGYEYE